MAKKKSEKKKPVEPKIDRRFNNPNTGRPAIEYTEEIGNRICHLIAITPRSLKRICEENPDLPHVDTIYTWRVKYKTFSDKYFEAKRQQAILLAEETLEISDDGTNDFMLGKDGQEILNSEHVQRSKLRVATRQWHAARLMPKLFGDRVQTETVDASKEELLETIKKLRNDIDLLKKHERDY